MRKYVQTIVAVGVCLATQVEAANDSRAIDDLSQRLKAHYDSMSNLHVESTWDCTVDGQRTATEHQILDRDSLGRVRVRIYDRVTYSAAQLPETAELAWWEEVFDGQNIVVKRGLRRKQDPLRGFPKIDMPLDVHATIKPGLGDRKSPDVIKSPISVGLSAAVAWLEQARDGDVVIRPGRLGVVEVHAVSIDDLDDPESAVKSVAIVDMGKGGVVTAARRFDGKNRLTKEHKTDYEQTDSGIWLPISGHIARWTHDQVDTTPQETVWSFRVAQARVNNPTFDESVFETRFEPNTAIADERYDAHYRIGAEHRFDASLLRLAEQALSKPVDKRTRSSMFSQTWIYLGLGIAILVVLVVRLEKRFLGQRSTAHQ